MWVGNLSGLFDPGRATKLTVHGYNDDGFTWWTVEAKQNFLDAEDCNVVLVDWSGPAQGPLYNVAKANALPTGEYLRLMYRFLASRGQNLDKVHCVGHSLGAHVCGFSGKNSTGKIGRITGVDPAQILFSYDDPAGRLTLTDATFVDVIHTCGGWMSFADAIGHADFFPNGGGFPQPGCGSDFSCACSHARSADLFTESIKSDNFVSHKCDSWKNYQNGSCSANQIALMGYPTRADTRGSFFLATADKAPFALGFPTYL
ncbi:lipase member H-A-like isoform X2 [Neocloeon triangulifer]|nr:lipase member H-A-like isoform X2 [Neocloeon triangulifer]